MTDSRQGAVRLGFEVGTGEPVSIPMQHLVITGQTQRAGKTTALEALITRSNAKAVAFVTKRGEGSFADARTIPPYFREQADWKFVASILEASRGEKLKFERSWIIRASKGARTLADVQRNVRKALETAKGLSADVYLTLDAYLEDVVPLIARVQWAKRVVLAPGLNVVDMTALNVEMQHLVIRSTIEWVLEHENDTVVVVPEAWKFIPQGRGTPVKLAAESFIRQAAGLHNYLWLDSQDIAGVEKLILKSVPVWILGVQRESNEIKRTLAQIPAGIKKPKAEQIATLGLGEFFACHDTHVTQVYVQPAWMPEEAARAIAQGFKKAESFAPSGRFKRGDPAPPQEDAVNREEAERLERENAELRARVDELESRLREPRGASPKRVAASDIEVPVGNGHVNVSDELWAAIRSRLVKDPVVLKVIATKPQIDVEVRRQTVTADGDSWVGRVAQLLAEGFFDEPKKTGVVFAEAARRGAKGIPARADEAVKKLFAMGFLTREADGFLAVPDMKVNIIER